MTRAKDPTQAELMEVFEMRGDELWRKEYVDSKNRKYLEKLVENVANERDGYCQVKFKGRMVKYHRIVWILLKGPIPGGKCLDHEDGNPLNNNTSNLRLATLSENQRNRRVHREGRIPGIRYNKKVNAWYVWDLRIPGKPKYVGYYKTEQEAIEALKQHERKQCERQKIKTKANA